jgi:nitronate monooxygenase
MNIPKLRELKIGDLIARIPIIQGGMGVGISLSGLAAATAETGGIGVIAAAGIGLLEPDGFSNSLKASVRSLRTHIRRAREMTRGILGVNIMVAITNFADMVRTAVEEKIDIIFAGAGLPLNLPEFLLGSRRTKLVPIVSSGRAANLIARKWEEKYSYFPDAFVVEGPKAGGHLGFKPEQISDPNYALEILVSDVIAAVKPYEERAEREIPVIAAGGVFSGGDIRRFVDLGAAGVQMATRFVATSECDASEKFKNVYLDSKAEDLTIIKSPVGMPGRAIRNRFLADVEAGKRKPFSCPYHCIVTCDYRNTPYCISLALLNAQRGKLNGGFAFAGANAYRVNGIVSVKQLVGSLVAEYEETSAPKAALPCSPPRSPA